jgi:hypothetical protein
MKDFFLINGIVKVIDELFFILRKFKSIFIDVKLNLTNINQVLIDFKVTYEILTKDVFIKAK